MDAAAPEQRFLGQIGRSNVVVLGYFPGAETIVHLLGALAFYDPRLKYFALASLLRLGQAVEANDIAAVAVSSEMRNELYRKLEQLHKLDLYPAAYRTQAAFAESDMVNWLSYPTELARVPDEIQLGKSITVETEGGELIYYVFRFRSDSSHWAAEKGWMAGVSGPFIASAPPGHHSLGETFSTLDPWESKTPEEHLGNIQNIMERWREYRKTREALATNNGTLP